MEFRTVQGASVKLLIESLKELTNDVNVRFDASGVHVTAMDGCHCALFHEVMEINIVNKVKNTRWSYSMTKLTSTKLARVREESYWPYTMVSFEFQKIAGLGGGLGHRHGAVRGRHITILSGDIGIAIWRSARSSPDEVT
eukprot:jgi/Mesvir1/10314/Mv23065-RA.1